ncbi:MAG TPA: OPT family oligopeptide transporter [Polyangiaceae bacterium]|nr:OPT family oligopeptide transporter [Polyangiaceae bacterium]
MATPPHPTLAMDEKGAPSDDAAAPVVHPADDVAARARKWRAQVYRGDMPQLTVRAVLTGMLLGGIMTLSNLYVGLKIGWSVGITITSCILAYALFSAMKRVVPGLRQREFTILENNMMASVASAAGLMSASVFVTAVPALYLTVRQTLAWPLLAAWATAVSLLGVFMAIPMKRQQIDVEQLPFPSGMATAETLTALHERGDDAAGKAWALGGAGLFGALVSWFRDAHAKWMPFNLPGDPFVPSWSLGGQSLARLSLGIEPSVIMLGAGAIVGIRVGISLLVSALVCYGVVGPHVLNHGFVGLDVYRQKWALWPGVGLLVSSGLTAFFWRWRTIVRAFAGLRRHVTGQRGGEPYPLADLEAPPSWFTIGFSLSGVACIVIGAMFFQISVWMGIVAVLATFLLALVASRATGETDFTPVAAMGKVTQLVYGLLAPGNMTTNLMTASITGGAAIHTADLLTDLKAGYLLGANPRKQVLAQIFGVAAGTIFAVPAYLLLVDPDELGGDKWPAPAAQVWAGVAKIVSGGLSALPAGAAVGIALGAAAGTVLALIEELVPKAYKRYTLSSAAVGIAWIVPGWNSVSLFLGALLGWALRRANDQKADRYVIPVASGLIAGESLVAVLIAALVALRLL